MGYNIATKEQKQRKAKAKKFFADFTTEVNKIKKKHKEDGIIRASDRYMVNRLAKKIKDKTFLQDFSNKELLRLSDKIDKAYGGASFGFTPLGATHRGNMLYKELQRRKKLEEKAYPDRILKKGEPTKIMGPSESKRRTARLKKQIASESAPAKFRAGGKVTARVR